MGNDCGLGQDGDCWQLLDDLPWGGLDVVSLDLG
jgi:hypothetical protein